MDKQKTAQIVTIPNLLSLFRILLLIPIAFFLWHDNLIAVGLLAFLSFSSDYLDGIIARNLNQISDLGKFLDPLADKLSFGVVLVVLWYKEAIPLWLMIFIIARDFAILTVGLFIVGKYKKVVDSNFIGKTTSNILAVMIIAYIFQINFLIQIFTPLAVVFIILSSLSYLKRFLSFVKSQ